ncbi:MAG: hypothetical protein JWO04_1476 [Gammaproteobacteria bacterium]|nr:hypothetical protein [Gammaproteobacteria bacterium]
MSAKPPEENNEADSAPESKPPEYLVNHIAAAPPRELLDHGYDVPYLNRYRRFFRVARYPLPSIEERGILRKYRRYLDRHLTVMPPNADAGIWNAKAQDPGEVAVEQDKAYLEAEKEFAEAPEGTVDAWIERKRLLATWPGNEEYGKARRNSVLASFISILITHTDLYPTKIPAIGVEFPSLSKPAFLVFLLGVTWYLTMGMNILVRGYLIERAFLEIAHASKGIYKGFVNRYSRFIDVTAMEKNFFDRRLPNLLCIYASISIIVALVRYFIHR